MSKTRFIYASIFVFVALSLFISPKVRAEITCPAGYICTRATDSALQCPTGYICTPANYIPKNDRGDTNVPVSAFAYGDNKLHVTWQSHTGNFDYYRISIVNTVLNKETEISAKTDKSRTVWEGSIPSSYLDLVNANSSSRSANYVKINSIRSNWYGPSLVKSATSSPFNIKTQSSDDYFASPVISSISPSSGPIGTRIEIKGENLSGLEGDLDVYFEDSSGQKFMLTDNSGSYARTAGRSMVIMVKEPCQKGDKVIGRYSGIESQCKYVALKPGNYKVYVNPYGVMSNSVNFTVTSGGLSTSPEASPMSTPGLSQALVSAELVNIFTDQVGSWNLFVPAKALNNENRADWHWNMILNLPTESKTISRITIKHKVGGEVWSTGNSRYLGTGRDLYNYVETPYPLAVIYGGRQLNTDYNKTFGPFEKGKTILTLVGQPEYRSFIGGDLYVEFTDGTTAFASIPSSTLVQPDSEDLSSNTIQNYTPVPSASPSNTSSPIIYSIIPSSGSANTNIVVNGANMSRVTSIEFYNSKGQLKVSLPALSTTENKAYFSLANSFTSNSESGSYNIKVVSSDCKGGCASNSLNFTVNSQTITNSPSPTATPNISSPAVSFVSPQSTETWYIGDSKSVRWTYTNFDDGKMGDKFVELILMPTDGRAPVTLGTYTYPYNYQPLNIYRQTSTGKDAWLPGNYKLKLSCRSSNIDGYRSCGAEFPGYIYVKENPYATPSPTANALPVSQNASTLFNASVLDAVRMLFNSSI